MVFRNVEREPILEGKEDLKKNIWRNLEVLSERGFSEALQYHLERLKKIGLLLKADFRLDSQMYSKHYLEMLKNLQLGSKSLSLPKEKFIKTILEISIEEMEGKLKKASAIYERHQEKEIEKMLREPWSTSLTKGSKFEILAALLFNTYEIPAVRSVQYDDFIHETKEFPSPDVLILWQDQIFAFDTTLINYEPPFMDPKGITKFEKIFRALREHEGIKLSFGLIKKENFWRPRYFPDLPYFDWEGIIIKPPKKTVPIFAFPLTEERFEKLCNAIGRRPEPSSLGQTIRENFLEPFFQAMSYQLKNLPQNLRIERANQVKEFIEQVQDLAKSDT